MAWWTILLDESRLLRCDTAYTANGKKKMSAFLCFWLQGKRRRFDNVCAQLYMEKK